MATKKEGGTLAEIILSDKLKKKKIGIAVASWNKEITGKLLKGAEDLLKKHGVENIITHWVPGSFELPIGAKFLIEFGNADTVLCLGCLIKGETDHYHYISESVAVTLNQLAVMSSKPIMFGVLTVNTQQQAEERAGGIYGNKGAEAAEAALQMLQLKENIIEENKPRKSIGFGGG
ncbi:MAG: 6,7-dimethyl-8-ribityllumazine synthase [Bacteroidetes bacterium]|nr:6,7-dimethyl-8-ribityllumazine synthase [Bacteroidota bacterium]